MATCLRLGVEGVLTVLVMDAESSWIAFATFWTTAGPREDTRNRFDESDGGGDEEMEHLR